MLIMFSVPADDGFIRCNSLAGRLLNREINIAAFRDGSPLAPVKCSVVISVPLSRDSSSFCPGLGLKT